MMLSVPYLSMTKDIVEQLMLDVWTLQYHYCDISILWNSTVPAYVNYNTLSLQLSSQTNSTYQQGHLSLIRELCCSE